ncbi:MAG: FHA domain-containing protein [Deltaproteobacteria bacterium]|nr:FHA domain-containing protein [Deltaproteobacteria bacterium]
MKPDGATIRDLRLRKGLKVEQLARRAGISEKTLRLIEKNQTETPHPETVSVIAKALNVEPESLFPAPPPIGIETTISPFAVPVVDGIADRKSSLFSEAAPLLAYLILRDKQQMVLSRYRITSELVTIGRSVDNTIKLSDALVSENHAILSVSRSSIQIRDLGSTNGTCVNGQRITGRVEIRYGEPVAIGPYVIELLSPDTDPNAFPVHETGLIRAKPPV